MKPINKISVIILASALLLLAGCGKEGPAGRDGLDGNANVIYSPWYTPNSWNGQTGDWYFQVANSAISQDVVEGGVILAYVSLPNDIYPAAVRPLPCYAQDCNWSYLIPDYGTIEFICDALNQPGTSNYYFRFILIPANNSLKSTSDRINLTEKLKSMSYLEICKKYNIPE